jgi:hypothetical protein
VTADAELSSAAALPSTNRQVAYVLSENEVPHRTSELDVSTNSSAIITRASGGVEEGDVQYSLL